jgi:hypothetical protein
MNEAGHAAGGWRGIAELKVRIHSPLAVSQANFRIAPLARPDLVERQPELQCPARASAVACPHLAFKILCT